MNNTFSVANLLFYIRIFRVAIDFSQVPSRSITEHLKIQRITRAPHADANARL